MVERYRISIEIEHYDENEGFKLVYESYDRGPVSEILSALRDTADSIEEGAIPLESDDEEAGE